MNPVIERLQEKIAKVGLHEVVAARLRAEGHKVASMDHRDALVAFGATLYKKAAENQRIAEGLRALKQLRED